MHAALTVFWQPMELCFTDECCILISSPVSRWVATHGVQTSWNNLQLYCSPIHTVEDSYFHCIVIEPALSPSSKLPHVHVPWTGPINWQWSPRIQSTVQSPESRFYSFPTQPGWLTTEPEPWNWLCQWQCTKLKLSCQLLIHACQT